MATENVSAGKIGKYEIIRLLGRGGMGEVLLAQDVDLARLVAIKRPFKSAAEDGLARFHVEAKAATLKHPNIPTVFEMGVQDGLPFIAMEYVEGESLDKIISSGKPLDLITKLRIIEQVCSALGYAHENGIIHRDIKPANVIVQKDGVAKIIDFGIAKIHDSGGKRGLTQTSAVIGSLHYIAPERFKGGSIDGRVDIFSAGVTLFKLLTGEEPFTGGEETASYKIVNEAHTPLSKLLHDYPPALDDIVAKSLAKNPDDRYSTGEDFADALHDVIEDLKRSRVAELFSDAERLTMESRYTPALELLEEAARLDPVNTQVRKLRKLVREHQERVRRAERIRECISRADEAQSSGNFEEALSRLKDAQGIESTSSDIKLRIQSVEEKKRRHEISSKALAGAVAAQNIGDITGALRIVAKALQDDPENRKLLAINEALAKQVEIEAQRRRFLEILENARWELAARNFTAVEKLLGEAESIDPANLETGKLRQELRSIREKAALEEIQARVNDLLRIESFDQAADLLARAIERRPNELMLHRLKAEVDSEASKFKANRFVGSVISQARELASTSPYEALANVQKALEQMPGEERLVSYERSLREQLESARAEKLRADTFLKAQQLMAGKQFGKAIEVLESFQIDFGRHPDIDDLLATAWKAVKSQTQNVIVEKCFTEGRALIREGRLEEAIGLLESGIEQTGDESLTRLLEEARERQVAFARKIEVLEKRVAFLRERGEFDEAIPLLQEQLAATPGNVQVQELLAAVLAEREHRQATGDAIAAAGEAAQRRDFSAGLESLEAIQRAYGESSELTRAIRDLQTQRTTYAREIVGRSIESARAALFKSAPEDALAALEPATQWMEFSDPKQNAEWQRIGQEIKKALKQARPADTGSHFAEELSKIARTKPRKIPIRAIAAACAMLLVVGAVIVWKMHVPPPPPPVSEAQIQIAKAPPAASVSIDGGAPQPTDAKGGLKVPNLKPGQHEVVVSKPGYETFTDTVEVGSGETFREDVLLTPLPPAGAKTGTFTPSPQGGLTEVKVFVDGVSYGVKPAGAKITLKIGAHTVKYAWPGYQDSKDHTIQIAQDTNVQDPFTLDKSVPPPPSTGRLTIQTTPEAQIAIDGHNVGSADSSGSYTVQELSGGQHSVDISLDKYQPVNRTVTIAAGQTLPLSAPLTPVPPPLQPSGTLNVSANSIEKGKSVQLTWDVKNASTVSISNYGDGLGPRGSVPVYPTATTTYQLTANGTQLDQKTVTVSEPAPPPVAVEPPAKPVAPARPDREALEPALNPYKSLFAGAAAKGSKGCKAALNGAYQGGLSGWAKWCDDAKSFEASVANCHAGGSADAPTLTCTETITIHPRDGDPSQTTATKTFHFAKGQDGSWKISGWQ